jgi:hypothetical protein
MFATLHSMVNSFESGLFHLTGQPNSQKRRAAKVKDGIVSEIKFLGTISKYRYKKHKTRVELPSSFYHKIDLILFFSVFDLFELQPPRSRKYCR